MYREGGLIYIMSNQKGFGVVLVIVILAAVVLGGGVYFNQKARQAEKKAAEEQALVLAVAEKERLAREAKQKEEADKAEKIAKINASIEIKLDEQNKSKESGKAVFSNADGKVKVDIEVAGEPSKAVQPAHLHLGTCEKPGEVQYSLTDVTGGKSDTMLPISMEELRGKLPLILNIHKSGKEPQKYVACGEVKSAVETVSPEMPVKASQ